MSDQLVDRVGDQSYPRDCEELARDRHGRRGAAAAVLDEHRERDVALPADEPGVRVRRGRAVELGGAGLAVHRRAGQARSAPIARARGDHLAHHRAQRLDRVRLERRAVAARASPAPGR